MAREGDIALRNHYFGNLKRPNLYPKKEKNVSFEEFSVGQEASFSSG
jgi:hypothetical protein